MEDEPVAAMRKKKDSSIVRAAELVRKGEADALVSLGNTGGIFAAATFGVGASDSYGLDAKYSPSPSVIVNGFWAQTKTPGLSGRDQSYLARFDYSQPYRDCPLARQPTRAPWQDGLHPPNGWGGVAVTMWVGFDLKPRDVFIAPVYAIRQVLERAGLKLSDIDLFELNEAFAAQMLACGKELKINESKVNVKTRRELADEDEARPPLRVEFAGGHRIAVETEALVRRESIINTVGSLATILPVSLSMTTSEGSLRHPTKSRWSGPSIARAALTPAGATG